MGGLNPAAPAELVRIIAKALEKDRDLRLSGGVSPVVGYSRP